MSISVPTIHDVFENHAAARESTQPNSARVPPRKQPNAAHSTTPHTPLATMGGVFAKALGRLVGKQEMRILMVRAPTARRENRSPQLPRAFSSPRR